MKEVVSNVTQLMNAYRTHYRYSKVDKQEISHHLLLVYAVECGIKAQYLKDYNRETTAQFSDLPSLNNTKYGHGHDILKWVKALRLPANVIGTFIDKDARLLIQLHERLRYGVFSPQLENEQIALLQRIANALNDSLNS